MDIEVVQVYGSSLLHAADEIVLANGDRLKILINPKVGDTVELLNGVVPNNKTWRARVEVHITEAPAA